MYLSILEFQIKYVISESHMKISCLSTYMYIWVGVRGFLVGGFGRQPSYDEMGAAARNIHCYTVIGFW